MVRLSIGEVARRSGLSVSALRYYDQRGLLPELERVGGKRRFPSTVVRRLALIRAAREAGFTLNDIKLFLDRHGDTDVRQQWETMATHRLGELDQLIGRLVALRATVAGCLECGCLSPVTCQLLD
jgi:MerR family redox-sensitive transcriptional activator SoxR